MPASRRPRFPVALPPVAALALLLPGCIVQDIHRSIEQTNDHLSVVQLQLNELRATNQKLDRLDGQLQQLDGRLTDLDRRLSGLDDRLVDLDGGLERRLAYLASIDASLQRLDAHLASLRVTIEKINSAIPFFDFGGGDDATTRPADGSDELTTRPSTRPVVRVRPRPPETPPDGTTPVEPK